MARNKYDVDEVLEESFDVGQLKRLAQYILPYKTKMLGVVFLMLSSSALTMLVPIFLQKSLEKTESVCWQMQAGSAGIRKKG